MNDIITIATDGCCKGNPGPGGWAAVFQMGYIERVLYGYDLKTTNNQMELMAAIRALEYLKKPCSVEIIADSIYVIKGYTIWQFSWEDCGWAGVKNKDLWQRLRAAGQRHTISWKHVRGHRTHRLNNLADRYANLALSTKTNLEESVVICC